MRLYSIPILLQLLMFLLIFAMDSKKFRTRFGIWIYITTLVIEVLYLVTSALWSYGSLRFPIMMAIVIFLVATSRQFIWYPNEKLFEKYRPWLNMAIVIYVISTLPIFILAGIDSAVTIILIQVIIFFSVASVLCFRLRH
ncbi:hypothetical protein [Companilactobacillus hulinensis]|uniref:hypothetical protein n=1 Tax=Companilactobacillus hulinensis TaxID=2486007 RepID=UPI0013DDA615|nr:hypothetical protein [Companilactobacillus hulinensis]